MKIVFLSKAIHRNNPWECSTAKFVEEYLGLKLKPHQKLMLNLMDFRDGFNKRFRPLAYYAGTLAGQRGLAANLLICDEDFTEKLKGAEENEMKWSR